MSIIVLSKSGIKSYSIMPLGSFSFRRGFFYDVYLYKIQKRLARERAKEKSLTVPDGHKIQKCNGFSPVEITVTRRDLINGLPLAAPRGKPYIKTLIFEAKIKRNLSKYFFNLVKIES